MKRDTTAEDAPVAADAVRRYVLPGLGLVIAIAGLVRVVSGDSNLASHLDDTTLLYLGVAAALILARDLKSFAIGDYKLEFERTRRIALAAKVAAEDAQANALGTGKQRPERGGGGARSVAAPTTGTDDPWKGQFGGAPEVNGRRLEATVTERVERVNPYRVELRVRSTNPQVNPLRGTVQFFLHPTFQNDRPIVTVGPSGEAELTLRAYGAFTVGAVADAGNTRLELDLAELPGAPQTFRSS